MVLVGVGALSHSIWSLAAKKASSGGDPLSFMWSVSLLSTTLLTVPAIWILQSAPLGWRQLLLACGVAGVIHTCYFFVMQTGYSLGDVSVLFPMARGIGPLLSVGGAILLFGESPNGVQLLGALTLICGVLLISLVGGRGGSLSPSAAAMGVATGAAIACYTLWDAFSVTRLGTNPIVQMWGTGIGVLSITSLFVLRRPDRLRYAIARSRTSMIIAGVLGPINYTTIMFAMQLAPASLVAPSREISVVIVSLAGWLLFKEPNPVPRIIGSAVVFVGALMIALG